METTKLDRAYHLYTLGFAILWLKPNSKQPIKMGWTKGPRETWGELKATYNLDYNVGVRLGAPSVLNDGTHLVVLDCDLKSSDPADREAMESRLSEILKTLGVTKAKCVVRSGRANGSCHIYLRTPKLIKEVKLGGSDRKCKVKMSPSTAVSVKERELLTDNEIQLGVRIRTAWEITLMSDGRQVVLPPSIHPDTGAAYEWASVLAPDTPNHIDLIDVNGLDLILKNAPKQSEKADVSGFKFTPVDLVLELLPIDNQVIAMIKEGEGVEDRSASLYFAATALVKAGLSDNEILTVLTDPDNFLASAGYDHAKTENRDVAARWVYRYTLAKARKESDARLEFEDAVEVRPLNAQEAKAQLESIAELDNRSWIDKLERTGRNGDGAIKNTALNLRMVLEFGVEKGTIIFDEFSNREIYGARAPWGGVVGQELSDIDYIAIKVWCRKEFGFEPSTQTVFESVSHISRLNAFHPVRIWLNSLEWDNTPRVHSWLKTYLGANGGDAYLAAVSTKLLVAMVARVFNPGVKFDQVVVLEGAQGVGKSSALRILAGEWFSDGTINFQDKDAVLQIAGKWLVELGELAGLNRSDIETVKAFVSRQVDRVRLPYGRKSADYPRQCVMVGTTNSSDYLKDETGARRFWPVKVTKLDREGLENMRDQLFAEAVFLYKKGEPLYLVKPDEIAQALDEQSARNEDDVVQDAIEGLFSEVAFNSPVSGFDPSKFTMKSLFELFSLSGDTTLLGLKTDVPSQKRVARALLKLGYERCRIKNVRYWQSCH